MNKHFAPILSDDVIPDGRRSLAGPVDVALDTLNDRILVVDEDFEWGIALHPDTGARDDFRRRTAK